jgi:hypothetical protein
MFRGFVHYIEMERFYLAPERGIKLEHMRQPEVEDVPT